MSTDELSPVVKVAKEKSGQGQENGIVVLPSGIRVRVLPVSAALITDVSTRIKDPEIPVVYIQEKDRSEPNPADPVYLQKMKEAENKRGSVTIDTMVMFGVELVDGVPEDNGWLDKLRFAERRGLLDLTEYDLNDPIDKEFLFKRYYLGDNGVIALVTKASGLSAEEVDNAEKSFQRT